MIDKPKKIHITGPVGSGKTYLADNLSKVLSIKHFQLDNFVWSKTKNNDIRNSEKLIDKLMADAVMQDSWIIEGAQSKWVDKSFESADIIIYLIPGTIKRSYFIIKRFIKQKVGLEIGNYKETLSSLIQLYKWTFGHDNEMLLKKLEKYKHKLIILKDTKEIEKYLTEWRK